MSFTAAVIVLAVMAALLFAVLAFVMSRPRRLRPHRPSRWRRRGAYARREHPPHGAA